MEWIPDASVAHKWHFDEPRADKARALLQKNPETLAPDLLLSEFAAAAVKKVRRGLVSEAHAAKAVEKISRQILRQIPARKLIRQAFEMAMELGHAPHDCFYLALAKREGAKLITDDIAFHRKVARSRWRENILLLADCE